MASGSGTASGTPVELVKKFRKQVRSGSQSDWICWKYAARSRACSWGTMTKRTEDPARVGLQASGKSEGAAKVLFVDKADGVGRDCREFVAGRGLEGHGTPGERRARVADRATRRNRMQAW